MTTDRVKRTSVMITTLTKAVLDSIKHPGQSYDGLIQEMAEFWKKEHPKEARQSTG